MSELLILSNMLYPAKALSVAVLLSEDLTFREFMDIAVPVEANYMGITFRLFSQQIRRSPTFTDHN